MDDHVGFPLVFEVAGARNLDESKENPREKENKAVYKEERHACFDCWSLSSELSDVGLEIVWRQVLEFH